MAREAELERVVLPVRPGAPVRSAEPVRIFLGTESAQYRAERVFLWSIDRVRDPGRVYEIVLMRDLPGFDRRGWTTSFTNYRFAVPHLAGATGRAIYNDVDQIYLGDPAELFDLDLDGRGYLAVSDSDTSVMLLDCAKLAGVWPIEVVRHERKRKLLDRARSVAGLYGALAPEWNARDAEYERGRSKLLHYTTLHEQPWRPFPERFVYYPNPQARLWFDLEADADQAGFQVFTRERPSARFRRAIAEAPSQATAAADTAETDAAIRRLAELSGARSLLEITTGSPRRTESTGSPGQTESASSPRPTAAAGDAGRSVPRRLRRSLAEVIAEDAASADGVLALAGLESLPPEDAAWVVDELFRHATRFVFAAVRCPPRRRPARGQPPAGSVGKPEWWVTLFEQAAARHPTIHWELAIPDDPALGAAATGFRCGGRFLGPGPPRVWLLGDARPGHSTQSVGLADELGWPCTRKDMELSRLAELPNALLGASLAGVRRQSRALLAPPWPDLVLASGRRVAPVARWIRARSRGRTRIVQLGRKGVDPPERFDLTVVPAYARLLAHPRRMQIAAPLTRVRGAALEEAKLRWQALLESAPQPRIALLVGGDSQRHAFTPETARQLAADVMELAASTKGSVFATTSRRTSPEAAAALADALADARHVHLWQAGQSLEKNPYLGYLALAEVLVVTGESASMAAEACATGKPVLLYPLPERRRSLAIAVTDTLIEAVVSRAHARPRNRRGTTRPQKRLERLCSILLARGSVRPVRDIGLLHRTLIEGGAARPFGKPFEAPHRPFAETAAVAARVRRLIGYPD